MSLLTFVALAFALTQQPAVPQQAAVAGAVLEAGSNTPVAGAQVTLMSFAYRPQFGRLSSHSSRLRIRRGGIDSNRLSRAAIASSRRKRDSPPCSGQVFLRRR